MGPVVLCVINHVRLGISDKTKTTRALGFGILHNNHIYDFSPFLEMSFKRLISSAVVKTTNENFTVDLGLILKVGQSLNKMADSVASFHDAIRKTVTGQKHHSYCINTELKRVNFCGSSSINQPNQLHRIIKYSCK